MTGIKKLAFTFRRWRGRIRRVRRLIYMSPAEARFVQLMGGKVITFEKLKPPGLQFPPVLVWSLGRHLKDEHFKREVRIGKYFVDFGNDVGRVIEIDGDAYHMDVLADLERDGYLQERGQTIMRIPAHRIYRDGNRVQRDVLKFIYR